MRKKQLKEMHDKAIAYGDVNKVFIESSLRRLKQEHLTDEDRIKEVKLLEQELKLQNDFEKAKDVYRERKAGDNGYWIGAGASLFGVFIAEVGPKIIKVLAKK